MWCDELEPGLSWSALWHGYIRCGCGGIRRVEGLCPACNAPAAKLPTIDFQDDDGQLVSIPRLAFAGGERGIEDYIYLEMLEREWKRPIYPAARIRSLSAPQLSQRAAFVVLYWSYFETRIERLVESGTGSLPPRVAEELLTRHAGVGARMKSLYRILFGTTFRADLNALGFEQFGQHLDHVQDRRNAFAHGDPRAIDDALVTAVVENLKLDHEAWIAVFNRRVSKTAYIRLVQ